MQSERWSSINIRPIGKRSEVQLSVETLAGKSIREKALLYIQHVHGERSILRFFLNGLIFTAFKEFPTIFGSCIRPFAYKGILGSLGAGCLVERSVRIEVPSRLFLGDRVFIGQNSWISPGGKDGEITLADETFIAHSCTLRAEGGQIIVGKNVQISRNCYLNGAGGIDIGNDTLLGPNVSVVSVNHLYHRRDIPIRLQGTKNSIVRLGSDVWVGANAAILPGASIADGSVIAAGSVVKGDIPPFSIASGVPAKVIGTR